MKEHSENLHEMKDEFDSNLKKLKGEVSKVEKKAHKMMDEIEPSTLKVLIVDRTTSLEVICDGGISSLSEYEDLWDKYTGADMIFRKQGRAYFVEKHKKHKPGEFFSDDEIYQILSEQDKPIDIERV